MKAKKGDIFKSGLNGEDYIVKRVVNNMVVLESQNGEKQILTGIDTLMLKTFYSKKEDKEA